MKLPTKLTRVKPALKAVKAPMGLEGKFKRDLSDFLRIQKNKFNRSGILQHLYKAYPVRKEYITRYVERELDFQDRRLYNIMRRQVKAQYNLVKSRQGEPEVKFLPRELRRDLRQVTKNINEFTKEQLVNKIHKSLKLKHDINKARAEVKYMFNSMEDYRAQRIMRTELNKARNVSFIKSLEKYGIDKKKWIDVCKAACEACKGNVAVGWIPLKRKFPSGHKFAPAHVNCDCAVV